MTKLFKLKNLIIWLVVMVLVTSLTAFSVSYARWVGPNQSLNASVGIGSWNNDITIPGNVTNGIVYVNQDGEHTTVNVNYQNIGNDVEGLGGGWRYYLYFGTAQDSTTATFAMSRGAGGTGGDAYPTNTVQIQQSSGKGQLKIDASCNDGVTSVIFIDEHTIQITGATVGAGGVNSLSKNDFVFELFYFQPGGDDSVTYTLTKKYISEMKASDDNTNTDIQSLRSRITVLG